MLSIYEALLGVLGNRGTREIFFSGEQMPKNKGNIGNFEEREHRKSRLILFLGTREQGHFFEGNKGTLTLRLPPLPPPPPPCGMRFQPVKCNMIQPTRKPIKKIHASYTLEGTNLENVESIKYLGVTITSDLRWNTHVSNVCTKANRSLGFLRRHLYSCPQEVKEAAYKGLVRPVLDYGSSVWDPPPPPPQV